jgi:hypothetical protein
MWPPKELHGEEAGKVGLVEGHLGWGLENRSFLIREDICVQEELFPSLSHPPGMKPRASPMMHLFWFLQTGYIGGNVSTFMLRASSLLFVLMLSRSQREPCNFINHQIRKSSPQERPAALGS